MYEPELRICTDESWLRCAKYCYHIKVHHVISAAKAASVTVFNAVHSV